MTLYMIRKRPKTPNHDELTGTYRVRYGKPVPKGAEAVINDDEDVDYELGEEIDDDNNE